MLTKTKRPTDDLAEARDEVSKVTFTEIGLAIAFFWLLLPPALRLVTAV